MDRARQRNMKHYTRHAATWLVGILLGLTSRVGTRASDRLELAGDVLQYLLPATAAGLTLGYEDGEGALQFGESAVLTLGVTYGLKYSIDEKRPNGRRHSFPSGHSSICFSSAEFMRKRYGWEYGIPAYAAASFVAYSRVEAREHHPHGVIAGASLGIGSSYILNRGCKGWDIGLEADRKHYGITLSHAW